MAQLEPLMRRNFLEYASYVVMDRAIPDIRDGLKPVQRRILHTLFTMHDGRFHKVANVIGEAMKLHPHGDAAIGDALVVLANKAYFIERQGNFGNIFTGHSAAAARYIECRLSPLAVETLFNKALTEFIPSYDGRTEEPVVLPSKLPTVLMLGTEGIAVGMATRIMPHNFIELLEAQIEMLKGKEVRVLPDFPQGGLMDASDYQDGRGKISLRARIDEKNEKTIVITEIPFSTTTESVIASVEAAAESGKVKIAAISDYTTEDVNIEIQLPRGVYASEVIPQLYAYTDCQVSIQSNLTVICEEHPAEMTVTQVLGYLTDQLLALTKRELEHELSQLIDRQHWLSLERIFIENRVYKRIEKAATDEKVRSEVWDGMHEFEKQFVRPMVQDDVDRLLAIKIRRISLYDINKFKDELKDVLENIADRQKKLKQLKKTTSSWLQGVVDKYRDLFPRKTDVATFETIDLKEIARSDIRVSYDPESGFFGTKVRGPKFQFTVSEYDRMLLISNDGSYRIVGAEEKLLIPGKLIHCAPFDPEKGKTFTIVYRDREKIAFAKRVHILKFVRAREYALLKEKCKIDMLIEDEKPGTVHLEFVPFKYQRITEGRYNLNDLELTGTSSRGARLSPKPVAKITLLSGE
jgi:topoisomerase-4 subunit A